MIFLVSGNTGEVIWTSPFKGKGILTIEVVEDLNGDGLQDILTFFDEYDYEYNPVIPLVPGENISTVTIAHNFKASRAISGNDGSEIWFSALASRVFGTAGVADSHFNKNSFLADKDLSCNGLNDVVVLQGGSVIRALETPNIKPNKL